MKELAAVRIQVNKLDLVPVPTAHHLHFIAVIKTHIAKSPGGDVNAGKAAVGLLGVQGADQRV